MEASAQGAGAVGGPQRTQEMPALGERAPGPQAATDTGAEHDAFADRPELYVGAAFAGGFVLAQIVKRFGR